MATAALVLVAGGNATLPGGIDALILAAWSLVALACGVGCAKAARRGLLAIVPLGTVSVATSLAIALAAMLVICAPAAIRLRGVWAR